MAETTLSRPELQAHERAMREPFDVVVKQLRDLLTPRLVAYLAGVRETRAVHQWADGTRDVKSADVEDRLRFALQVALLLNDTTPLESCRPGSRDSTPASMTAHPPACYAKANSTRSARSFWPRHGRSKSAGEAGRPPTGGLPAGATPRPVGLARLALRRL